VIQEGRIVEPVPLMPLDQRFGDAREDIRGQIVVESRISLRIETLCHATDECTI
jgi:hypothetical protein